MVICIAGMHRSGTSMVARLLNLSGLYLGKEDELFAGRPDNPEGFYEHRRFYAINDRILEVFEASWDLPKSMPRGWETDPRLDPIYEDAKKLVAEFKDHPHWGWKDPRSSLTIAFWRRVIPDLKIVVCLRNPADVCGSLTKRGYASTRFGFELWQAYMDAVEQQAPLESSLVTHYACYFRDVSGELKRLVAFCGLSPDEDQLTEASLTVNQSLRHNDSGLFELFAAKPDLSLVNCYLDACQRAGPVFEVVYREESANIASARDQIIEAGERLERKDFEMKAKEESLLKELKRTEDAIKQKEDTLLKELQRNIDEGRARMNRTIAIKDSSINGIKAHAEAVEASLRSQIEALEPSVERASHLASELELIKASRAFRLGQKLSAFYRSFIPARPSAPKFRPEAAPPPSEPVPVVPVPPKEELPPPKPNPIDDLQEFAVVAAMEKQQVELSVQARLGRKLLPPGSFQERFVRHVMLARQVARTEGFGAVVRKTSAKLARKILRRPKAPVIESQATGAPSVTGAPLPLRNPSELLETVRKEIIELEETIPVVEQYQRSIGTMLEKGLNRGPNYVPLDEDLLPPDDPAVKLIAFYLTQFHPIPENDVWWGKGFTEWTNVSKAVPVYAGQYQPHLPDELGFYDLRIQEVQERQVELAKKYGVHGFAFYYYWFDGKRLLERPLDNFLQNPNIDFPFCLIWANENWTRKWDGRQDSVLMGQHYSPESDIRFIADLKPYLSNPNYIRVNGRPLIIVYRPDQLPDPEKTAERWRDYCIRNDLGNPLIVGAQTFGFENPDTIGFDAAMQFPPHNENSDPKYQLDYLGGRVRTLDPDFAGCIYSYPALVGAKHNDDHRRLEDGTYMPGEHDSPVYQLYETAFPMWDNSARLPLTGVSYAYSSPELYKIWLQKICNRLVESKTARENRLVFINAWNEWAEGAHLEPDRRYGYAYLQATREALDFAKRVDSGLRTPETVVLQPDEEMEERLKGDPRSPILVYQLGKVGSRAIYSSLDKMALPEPVVHVHMLNNIDIVSKYVCKRYPHPEGTLFYLRRGKMVRDWMATAGPDTVWNVITGVREPISYSISSFFEMLPSLVPNIEKRFEADDISVEELQEIFLHQFDQRAPIYWFNAQFKPVFGIDVYETPFPCSAGYKIYEQGQTRALLIRQEDLGRTVAPAIEEFLGIKDFKIQVENRSEDKPYHALAVKFKAKPLPGDYVDRMLSTKYARHFYTPEELDAARRKWTQSSE